MNCPTKGEVHIGATLVMLHIACIIPTITRLLAERVLSERITHLLTERVQIQALVLYTGGGIVASTTHT